MTRNNAVAVIEEDNMRSVAEISEYILKSQSNTLFRKCLFYKTVRNINKDLYSTLLTQKGRNKKILSLINIHTLKKTKLGDIETVWTDYYSKHIFNVLGTGWVHWAYDTATTGFEGKRFNCSDDRYHTQIAWSRDMRSGYTFYESANSSNYIESIPEGADIKVPWELSRMYHLVQIALLALVNDKYRDEIIREFVFEINDFFSMPTKKNIHYTNAMEIAIRAANILFSYDILCQIDKNCILTPSFKKKLYYVTKLQERVIIANLEVDLINGNNGNHYLANLYGLVVISAYLNENFNSAMNKTVLAEFYKEVNRQFLFSGAHFECSTAYHRLCTEFVAISVAVLLSSKITIPENVQQKLYQAGVFMQHMQSNTGIMLQIGDNDSGHAINIDPVWIKRTDCMKDVFNEGGGPFELVEEQLSVKQQIEFVDALFTNDENNTSTYYLFCKSIIGDDVKIDQSEPVYRNVRQITAIKLCEPRYFSSTVFEYPYGCTLKGASIYKALDFGIIILKSDSSQLTIRTVPNIQSVRTNHIHNDFFSYELDFSTNRLFVDQGSYVYTADKEMRYQFRSDLFHNGPIYADKWVEFPAVFKAEVDAYGEVKVNENEIWVYGVHKDVIHLRKFIICRDRLIVEDYSNKEFKESPKLNTKVFSHGYGMKATNEEVV